MEYTHVTHTFEPVYDEHSKILVLGSFPSVKSREQQFYYGHPQNRFWKVMAACFDADVPVTIEEKKDFLLTHQIALLYKLPSTSPANAMWRFERLTETWSAQIHAAAGREQ